MTDHGEKRIGEQIGNYRLMRLLGNGGFADVYLGEHLHLGTLAAIKVLHTKLESEQAEMFRTEARTLARLSHSNIVRVFDFNVEDRSPFLVMDYAPGGTLRQRHPKGSIISVPVVVSYLTQIASALDYAHDQKVIHRDVKPENMLLLQDGRLVLSDFGVASIAHSTQSQTVKELAGTIYYIAPEQLQGRPRMASDQYGLGVVVYEWLNGQRPFQGSFAEIAS
ncbi:MAG TPA: serine/threonine-protein kinase, partial [Ktedonobacteraceae bacterium]